MSNATISRRPVSVSRMTHYYQGRPNVAFFDRYNTLIKHPAFRRN
jgi:hypothetical protein